MAKTSEFMPGRRDLFKHAAIAAVGVAAGRLPFVQAQPTQGVATSPFFPGFKTFKIQTSGATINGVMVPTPWEGHWSNYALRDGMRVPLDGEVAWMFPGETRRYWRGGITSIVYEFAN